jgi:hypothetical protein
LDNQKEKRLESPLINRVRHQASEISVWLGLEGDGSNVMSATASKMHKSAFAKDLQNSPVVRCAISLSLCPPNGHSFYTLKNYPAHHQSV